MNSRIIYLIGTALLYATPAAKANLLQNPSFEFGTTTPYSWNTWGDGDYIWQNNNARTGSRCMNLGGSDLALMYQRVAASPEQGYTITTWSKYGSGGGVGEIKLEFHNAAQTKIDEISLFISPPSEWTEYSITSIAPTNTAYVTATIVGYPGSTILFDDISVVEQINEPQLVIDLHNTSHTFMGFGTQAWNANAPTARLYNELNIQYARVSSTNAAAFAATMGINVMYLQWACPSQWMDSNNELLTQYVDDYATQWADTVDSLADQGIVPPYIELSNEPDGNWNTYISPANYNTLVKLTRAELDARGFTNVDIVGPSLAHLDWNGHNITWINALDTQAVSSIAAWGSHMWDDGEACQGGATCVSTVWPTFADPANAKDPNKPKFISEFATKENTFHGVTYPHPDSNRDYSAANTMPYAARTFENALALINNGTNVPFIWQATDQTWETKGWGLIDINGQPKPVYYALQTLWPHIPVDSMVIDLGYQFNGLTYSAAFVHDDRLVIAIANDSYRTIDRSIRITGAPAFNILTAQACLIDHHGNPEFEDPDTAQVVSRNYTAGPDNTIDVSLPADSTLAIVCDLLYAPSDINHDGHIDSDDFTILASCLAGPNDTPNQQSCTNQHFQNADFDNDSDVDLFDYAHFCTIFPE